MNRLNEERKAFSWSGVSTNMELDSNFIQSEEAGVNLLCLCHKTIDVLSGANALIDLSEARDNELVHEYALPLP